jgi:hypothetical protein
MTSCPQVNVVAKDMIQSARVSEKKLTYGKHRPSRCQFWAP